MMIKVLFWLLCVMFSGQVSAAGIIELADRKGCFVCHSINKHGIGPSWSEVAGRYRDQDGAANKLAASILYGSMGTWGDRPMRGQAKRIDKKQAKQIADFILNLAK
mgnify:CR=1 FL=1